jgi:hypothetical protein
MPYKTVIRHIKLLTKGINCVPTVFIVATMFAPHVCNATLVAYSILYLYLHYKVLKVKEYFFINFSKLEVELIKKEMQQKVLKVNPNFVV